MKRIASWISAVLGASGHRKIARDKLRIGDNVLPLQLDNKHEIAYLEKARTNIDEVDVAIARRMLKPGDLALDLGANIGYVSLHMLALGACEVHAFEPNPIIFHRLKSLRTDRLHCYPYAIGATSGSGKLILSVSHHQGSTLHPEVIQLRPKVFGEMPQTVEVPIRTIDELFPALQFDYIKVDIEGAEIDFVNGAHALLTLRPPRVLIVEIKPEFRDAYLDKLSKYFSCVRRVDYDRALGDIRLVEIDDPEAAPYRNQPPNYVFSNRADVFE
jgi:FkbM family methyltransferase